MNGQQHVTFVSHTNKPGGGELALRRYLEATTLPVRLVTLEGQGVWAGLSADVVEVSGLRGLARAIRGEKLVVANSMRAAFLCATVLPRGTRLVYWVRDGLADGAMSELARTLTKHVTRQKITHYLANSHYTSASIRQALGVNENAITVVHSMSGITVHDPPRPRTPPEAPIRLLYLGRIAPWKAPDVAIHALGELHGMGIDALLTIAGGALFGERRYLRHLQTLAKNSPGVSLLGHVPDVTDLLNNHDILIHSSILPEPFGQVVIQGLAAGLPVVATNLGGPKEILASSYRLLYRPGDPLDLAECVRTALADYSEVSTWSLNRARAYADEVMLKRTDEVLQALSQ
ncbi:glycosyltransferase [Ornithinimicrobium sp. W1665]|uniref:glycosyltransferase n=1 Tax=Ornithinimicrobium sp. W1665 TaxID=3416666 RepID=UPI003CF59F76